MDNGSLYRALTYLRKAPEVPSACICRNLQTLLPIGDVCALKNKLEWLWSDWEHYTGDHEEPVPVVGDEPYYHMWDYDHRYGKLRHSLLNHMIQKLEPYAILETLRKVEEDRDFAAGICANVSWHMGTDHGLHSVFRKYPYYSGSMLYPVPGGMEGYEEAQAAGNLWNPDEPQGAFRWSLLSFLIEHYEEVCNGAVL